MKTINFLKFLGLLTIQQVVYQTGWYCYKNYSWGGGTILFSFLICFGLYGFLYDTYESLDTRFKRIAKWIVIYSAISMILEYIYILEMCSPQEFKGEMFYKEHCNKGDLNNIQDIYPQ